MYKNILIATDGSDASGKGLDVGLDLARSLGASVTILTASEPYPAYDLGTKFGLFHDQKAVDGYAAECRKLADAILASAREVATAAGIACETVHVPDTRPANAILDQAEARGSDLIVVTSRGREGLERLLLGSQAARVVERAPVSVLVVR